MSAMSICAESIIIPAIPNIIQSYNLELNDSAWIIGVFIISGAIMTPVSSQISVIFGKINTLTILMILCSIGNIVGIVGQDYNSLIISRALQGVGLSIIPIGLAIMADLFPKDKIAIGQGLLRTITAFGGVVGLIVGGYLIHYFGWKSTFFVITPIPIIFIILIWIFIPQDSSKKEKIEIINRLRPKRLVLYQVQTVLYYF
ncbi:MFS transporter [Candidatus Nitrosocosmicus oleophilus]